MPVWAAALSALLGTTSVLAGVYLVSPPAALVVAGVALLGVAFAVPIRERKD